LRARWQVWYDSRKVLNVAAPTKPVRSRPAPEARHQPTAERGDQRLAAHCAGRAAQASGPQKNRMGRPIAISLVRLLQKGLHPHRPPRHGLSACQLKAPGEVRLRAVLGGPVAAPQHADAPNMEWRRREARRAGERSSRDNAVYFTNHKGGSWPSRLYFTRRRRRLTLKKIAGHPWVWTACRLCDGVEAQTIDASLMRCFIVGPAVHLRWRRCQRIRIGPPCREPVPWRICLPLIELRQTGGREAITASHWAEDWSSALACHYRVAAAGLHSSDSPSQAGGILWSAWARGYAPAAAPGWGQRALNMIVSRQSVRPRKLARQSCSNSICRGLFLPSAVALAERVTPINCRPEKHATSKSNFPSGGIFGLRARRRPLRSPRIIRRRSCKSTRSERGASSPFLFFFDEE